MFKDKRIALSALAFIFLSTSSFALTKVDLSKLPRANMYVTLYGSPDNTPPGGRIAYPVIHKQAGGVGTYADPVTFAVGRAGMGQFKPGTRVYYPMLRKYFIMEDFCTGCSKNHIDLWAGYGSRTGGILQCESKLTRTSAQVVLTPANNLPVDTTPIWNESTKKCQTPYTN